VGALQALECRGGLDFGGGVWWWRWRFFFFFASVVVAVAEKLRLRLRFLRSSFLPAAPRRSLRPRDHLQAQPGAVGAAPLRVPRWRGRRGRGRGARALHHGAPPSALFFFQFFRFLFSVAGRPPPRRRRRRPRGGSLLRRRLHGESPPPIEFYFHSAADHSVREEEEEEEEEEEDGDGNDENGNGGDGKVKNGGEKKKRRLGSCHSAALFVQLAPHAPGVSFLNNRESENKEKRNGDRRALCRERPLHETGALPASFELSRKSWTPEKTRLYSDSLLKAAEAWCPGLSSLVVDAVAFPPPLIEAKFGISGGHIHHLQNTKYFGGRVPLWLASAPNLFFASAGAHPGGSVTGAPGHNAAAALLLSMKGKRRERVLKWPTIKGDGSGSAGASSLWEAFARKL
jgi:hypothetical protein